MPGSSTHRRSSSLPLNPLGATTPSFLTATVLPFSILAAIVVASATQTEVAHHLTANVGFNQPYFTFFLTHITFALVFPVHVLMLRVFRPSTPLSAYMDTIRHTIAGQLDMRQTATWRDQLLAMWSIKISWLTILISVPALSWFVAVLFSPAMDVTAIYATSSFSAYFFSMLMLGEPLSKITMGSIVLAFAGVIVLSLAPGGEAGEYKYRLLGDLVMLFGAVILGLYEVVYKLALPDDSAGQANGTRGYSHLPTHAHPSPPIDETPPDDDVQDDDPELDVETDLPPRRSLAISRSPKTRSNGNLPERIQLSPTSGLARLPSRHSLSSAPSESRDNSLDLIKRPSTTSLSSAGLVPLPPALLSNFMTSCIGIATLVLLWIPIPICHWLGWESFRLPGSLPGENAWEIWFGLEVVAWTGSVYNAGLMVLIGIWGPTTSSVCNLLAIGLVSIIDSILMGHLPDLQTLIGVAGICVGFGILLWEGEG